jgi:saccharopine dehydrogenase-like NADP-dependent oxidoreductase
MKSLSYLIIGCGHFGCRAADQLLKRDPHSKIIAVDKEEKPIQGSLTSPLKSLLTMVCPI